MKIYQNSEANLRLPTQMTDYWSERVLQKLIIAWREGR